MFICDTAVPPGPPVARVVQTTDHSIDVEWDPPVDNGGGEILGYHVDKVRSSIHLSHFLGFIFSFLPHFSCRTIKAEDLQLSSFKLRLMFLCSVVFFRPWLLVPGTGPGLLSVLGRAGPSQSMESVKEPNIWSELLPATLLEREHQDSQSLCLSGIPQVSGKKLDKSQNKGIVFNQV